MMKEPAKSGVKSILSSSSCLLGLNFRNKLRASSLAGHMGLGCIGTRFLWAFTWCIDSFASMKITTFKENRSAVDPPGLLYQWSK